MKMENSNKKDNDIIVPIKIYKKANTYRIIVHENEMRTFLRVIKGEPFFNKTEHNRYKEMVKIIEDSVKNGK